MMTLTSLASSLSMDTTVLLGQQIGEGRAKQGGTTIEACIVLFGSICLALPVLTVPGAGLLASVMQAPALGLTTTYMRICGTGIPHAPFDIVGIIAFCGGGCQPKQCETMAVSGRY